MKLMKKQQPEPVQPAEESTGKKEKVGRPMLLPIVFCLISGVLLILLENLTMRITGFVLAGGLILQGAWLCFRYFLAQPIIRIVEAKLAIGLIALVTGGMLAFNPETLRDQLPYAWGLALLYGGFLKIQYAFDRKELGSEKWWILLIMAAFSLAIGVISLLNPAFLGDRKELVIGILLTLEAVLDLSVFLLLKRTIKKRITLSVNEESARAPAEPVPAEPSPAEPVPAQPAPAEPASVQPAPAEPAPVQPAPAEPAPAEPAPAEPAPAGTGTAEPKEPEEKAPEAEA